MKTQTIISRKNKLQSISKMLILILLMIFGFASNAQTKGIKLINKISNDSIFLKENQRIKIQTIDGKIIAGKFTLINDSIISVKNKIIQLDKIVTIRKASTFSGIIRTVSITFGSIFIAGGLGFASGPKSSSGYVDVNGIGAIIATIGTPFAIVPLTVNKHQNKKWKYVIVN